MFHHHPSKPKLDDDDVVLKYKAKTDINDSVSLHCMTYLGRWQITVRGRQMQVRAYTVRYLRYLISI